MRTGKIWATVTVVGQEIGRSRAEIGLGGIGVLVGGTCVGNEGGGCTYVDHEGSRNSVAGRVPDGETKPSSRGGGAGSEGEKIIVNIVLGEGVACSEGRAGKRKRSSGRGGVHGVDEGGCAVTDVGGPQV